MKHIALIVVAAALAVLGFAATGVAAPPEGGPPGQGECAHGNSNKPCKPDPQPDRGKDCEEHGPKEGGVNEDHCKGTTPPPPTTPEPPKKEEPSTPPTETQSTTETGTSSPPGTGSPEPGTSPTTPSESTEPGTSVTELEKQLEKQAKENGATEGSAPAPVANADALPYTGFETWMAGVLGLALIAAGLVLRYIGRVRVT